MEENKKIFDDLLSRYSEVEKSQAFKKLNFNLILRLGLLYLILYVDCCNLRNAYPAGMGQEWGFTSDRFGWKIMLVYIAYIAINWHMLLKKIIPLPLWVAGITFGWGTCIMIDAVAGRSASLQAIRCVMIIFRAGFAPGVALYLSFFYPRSEMGFRYALFISCSANANGFASALANQIAHATISIVSFKLVVLIVSIHAFAIPPLVSALFPTGPGKCCFLTLEENEIVRLRALSARGYEKKGKLNMNDISAALWDYKNYVQGVILLCLNFTFRALPAFLPTVIEDMGYSTTQAKGLSITPYLLAYCICPLASFASDRVGNRSNFVSILSILGGVGYLIQALVKAEGVRYYACFLICGGVFPSMVLIFTWVTDNGGSASKRGAGLVILSMLGQLGSIAGGRFFPKEEGPLYVKGMGISAGLLFFAAVLAQVLGSLLRRENVRRNAVHGFEDGNRKDNIAIDSRDDYPSFRFIL
ncbi:hypothetical protein N7457_000537 [Penicillium paradoxum]|uniref:uncharacterized protein n=1 Tax=Penicillium paradoxum TaxID=176176 RepID=UPI0025480C12|nr:uncharacterized protein N7457_000537 [Penicillium paradoxum]KAJ5793938.1 hypothetical protein N7457_000537 [Penicillium paradoxum]